MTQLRSATKIPPLLFLLIVIPLLLPAGCARKVPATTALKLAQRKAAETKDADQKLVLLTRIGAELLRRDPPRGQAVLGEARQMALGKSNAGPTARLYAISQRAFALSARNRRGAPAILSQAVADAERVYPPTRRHEGSGNDGPITGPLEFIEPARSQYGSLVAALAVYDPDQALRDAKRLADEPRKDALADIAEFIAGTDLPRAARLMQAALEPPSPPLSWLEWRKLCIAAARRMPRDALALARKRLPWPEEYAQVLEAAEAWRARKDPRAAQDVIAHETDAVVRAWGWLALAHVSEGKARDSAIRRAGETLAHAKVTDAVRSMVVTEWCLLAVMARPATLAKQYLDAAKGAQHDPPLPYERGMIMAAACYVDPATAMKIHHQLMIKRRTGPNRRSADTVLEFANPIVARVDVGAAERVITEAPDWARYEPAAVHLASVAVQTLPLDGKASARQLMRAAQRELRAQQRRVQERATGYDGDQRGLPSAMQTVATSLAAVGDAASAMRLTGQIRDPAAAGEAYLSIAMLAEPQPAVRSDPYYALESLAWRLRALAAPYEPEVRGPGRPAAH
jgi:hypothetical protein